MSKKGNYYDNASMESWNHSFKVETVHGERLRTRPDVTYQVFDYLEVYYNRKSFTPNWAILAQTLLKLKCHLVEYP